MPSLELKPTHKVVAAYYDNLGKFAKLDQVITVSLETGSVVKKLPLPDCAAETI
jgi:hypothetical protein